MPVYGSAVLQKEEVGALLSRAANGSSAKEQASSSGAQNDTQTDLSTAAPVELTPAQVHLSLSALSLLLPEAALLKIRFLQTHHPPLDNFDEPGGDQAMQRGTCIAWMT